MTTLPLLFLAAVSASAFEVKAPEPKPVRAEVEARALAYKYLAEHPELGVAPGQKPRRDECWPTDGDFWTCILNYDQRHQGVRVEYGETHIVVRGMPGSWNVREDGRRLTGLALSVIPKLSLAEARKATSRNATLPCRDSGWGTPAHEVSMCAIPESFMEKGGELVIFTGYPGENLPPVLAWAIRAQMPRGRWGSSYEILIDATSGLELQTRALFAH